MSRPADINMEDRARRERVRKRQEIMQAVLTGFTEAELRRLGQKIEDRLRQLQAYKALTARVDQASTS